MCHGFEPDCPNSNTFVLMKINSPIFSMLAREDVAFMYLEPLPFEP